MMSSRSDSYCTYTNELQTKNKYYCIALVKHTYLCTHEGIIHVAVCVYHIIFMELLFYATLRCSMALWIFCLNQSRETITGIDIGLFFDQCLNIANLISVMTVYLYGLVCGKVL